MIDQNRFSRFLAEKLLEVGLAKCPRNRSSQETEEELKGGIYNAIDEYEGEHTGYYDWVNKYNSPKNLEPKL